MSENEGRKLSCMTDADVEMEIERLNGSEAVRLARKEQRYKYRQRQRLYTLRWLEKRGRELMAQGMTDDDFRDDEGMEETA